MTAGATAPTVSTSDGRVPVSLSQVIVYAKKGCKTCFGKGTFTVTRVVDKNRNQRTTVDTCGCAIKQFFKKNPQVEQDPVTHTWYWPATSITPVDDATPTLETK